VAHTNPDDPLILIDLSAYADARDDAARHAGRVERGGVLLGLRRGNHLHVEVATRPTRWDQAGMFSFRRHTKGHAAIALRRWRQSDETSDWLGEWHSHPEPHPHPSSIDLRSWRGLTQGTGVPMVFVIFGYREPWVGLMNPHASHPVRYRKVDETSDGVLFSSDKAG
jgi:integrative and conjugative element protein (TIGR02256 family)